MDSVAVTTMQCSAVHVLLYRLGSGTDTFNAFIERNSHYPPETANIMLIARMIAVIQQASESCKSCNHVSRYCNLYMSTNMHPFCVFTGTVQQVLFSTHPCNRDNSSFDVLWIIPTIE